MVLNSHPSKDITGTAGEALKGKRVVLCITGSVAAVRSSEIARGLMRYGAEVFAVMSEMANKIIHPYLMEWATGNPVVTELTGKVEHVALVGERTSRADLVLVAPATANTISKIACGIDDTPVTSVVSTAFGSGVPIMIVPAMHESMYRHAIVAENIEKLKTLGVEFVGPRIEEEKAKIAENSDILEAVIKKLTMKKDLAGMRVLVTAGPTLEHIDPVRVMTNKSSGKMGVAVAREALNRGADVALIYGPGTALPPSDAKVIPVETTEEMHDAVISELKSKKYDVVVAAAAAADWRPEKSFDYKVSTGDVSELLVKLRPTRKIIDAVRKINTDVFLVPFKAEYDLSDEELVECGYSRLVQTEADMIVVNDVGRNGAGFRVDTNEVFIVDKEKKVVHVPLTTKREVARRIFDVITEKMKAR
ncbi:MAG: bifunctional phosphopantothenoylcysteine decarboxylase/phosphopantothenate--cysteine ligase CoaBC [Candidatus Bathyarchaeota archaeon]|nr:bifunctional phosphopantothenoylcysteine decarboxylase/phosphopantothenate--cysteine ligase CoaBC [Candidatus Bathyarchaeota archaeon]MDH5780063.1 bifunctional phosphopantothenoylcysteine decarboxylase/phosphopantothenate--cysteine ligase CoaBC [Candidatus Bathyarchaeota archaeon]